MMATIQSYVRQGRYTLRRWASDPRVHIGLRGSGYFLAGMLMSAASLGNYPQPLALSLVCAFRGWQAGLVGLGGTVGYLLFWGQAGLQGMVWATAGILAVLVLGDRQISKTAPLLLPALAGLIVAASGVAFQVWLADTTPVSMYLLRIALGAFGARLFTLVMERRDPILDWLACGLGVLALAQVAPIPYLGLGFLAVGLISSAGALPAAAVAGLAVDLARVTPVSMAAVASLAYFARFLPRGSKLLTHLAPGIAYCLVMGLCGVWDIAPLPALVLGGALGYLCPGQPQISHRRGETGIAQVRLEMVAGALSQTGQLLLETAQAPIDEEALMERAAQRACGSCPCRKTCKDRESAARLPANLLRISLLEEKDLPIACRKTGRLLGEVYRAQEQLRSIRADRERQREYQAAVVQQYHFLSQYVQDLSDTLARRVRQGRAWYQPKVAVCANRRECENGDRCAWFAGTENRYYVLLCDGMGKGMGAVDEGNEAAAMLKKLLSAGYPAEFALRGLNSLCALRGRAGAVTVDLVELHLDTGKASIYKWGAAPSYLLTEVGAEKIGTVTPPPGLSVTEGRETVERLSLRRGETLVLLSDGVGGEDALRCYLATPGQPLGEVAAKILECGNWDDGDDATVAAIRLSSASLGA